MSSSKNRFSELMDYFKIKQIDIAQKTGIPKSAISMYTNGQRTPRQNRLTIIADTYGLNEAWLMGYDVPMFKDENEEKNIVYSQRPRRRLCMFLHLDGIWNRQRCLLHAN